MKSLSANQTKELLTQPLVIQAGQELKAQASAGNQLHIVVSYLEITIELVRIPTENVNDAWGMVSQNIADALARSNGYARAEHIKEWILQNKMQLWILWDSQDKKYYGVVVTEIIQRPLQRCLNIKIMTGNHREKWQHLIKQLKILHGKTTVIY